MRSILCFLSFFLPFMSVDGWIMPLRSQRCNLNKSNIFRLYGEPIVIPLLHEYFHDQIKLLEKSGNFYEGCHFGNILYNKPVSGSLELSWSDFGITASKTPKIEKNLKATIYNTLTTLQKYYTEGNGRKLPVLNEFIDTFSTLVCMMNNMRHTTTFFFFCRIVVSYIKVWYK